MYHVIDIQNFDLELKCFYWNTPSIYLKVSRGHHMRRRYQEVNMTSLTCLR